MSWTTGIIAVFVVVHTSGIGWLINNLRWEWTSKAEHHILDKNRVQFCYFARIFDIDCENFYIFLFIWPPLFKSNSNLECIITNISKWCRIQHEARASPREPTRFIKSPWCLDVFYCYNIRANVYDVSGILCNNWIDWQWVFLKTG